MADSAAKGFRYTSCPENDPLCDGEMVTPPGEPGYSYPCPARSAASTCRYWLAEREGMAVTLLDGCHGDPEGVAEAAKLHRRIFGKKGEGWIMVEIHDLPDLDPPINEDAVRIVVGKR